jgi:hypothetical protein
LIFFSNLFQNSLSTIEFDNEVITENSEIEMRVELLVASFLYIIVFCYSQVCEEGDVCKSDISFGNNIKIAKGSNVEGKPPEVSFADCTDRHHECREFEQNNECTKNPGWMIVNCPKSCNACHLRDAKVRCQRSFLNISDSVAYAPGELSTMFASIEEKFSDRYDVNIVSTDPWIVTFDNFLTDDESRALITTVAGNWERSTDTGSVNEYGETGRVLSTGRTSSNAWCRHNCETNPHVQNVIRKIEEVTRIPFLNSESFQVLQYDVGQKYNTHHDMAP